ncbi:MAG: hypothetical protein ABW072_14890 [Sedimenticola sp.]
MINFEQKFEEIFEPVLSLAWAQSDEVNKVTKQALQQVRESDGLIEYLVRNILHNQACLDKCEKDYNIEKYVLFSHKESGVRMRMHVMYPHTFDIPTVTTCALPA